ncbi:hypothetical protein tb265_48550 [Gemmatimonadetes bacterium T265]|nr:hypothetical protein tb265_48550 [Gemmatimonadetes bacterium T265]
MFAYQLVTSGSCLTVREGPRFWTASDGAGQGSTTDVNPGRVVLALEAAVQLVAQRWKPAVVLCLAAGPRRRRDLEQHLPRGVSAKVLTEQLRALEADGIVRRVDRTPAGHGRHVTYSLTDLGQALAPAVASLAQWAVDHGVGAGRRRRFFPDDAGGV